MGEMRVLMYFPPKNLAHARFSNQDYLHVYRSCLDLSEIICAIARVHEPFLFPQAKRTHWYSALSALKCTVHLKKTV